MITSILARLKKAWIAWCAAPMERVICDCGTWFWRIQCEHPDTSCAECRDKQMDAWIANYEARQAHHGQSVRRIG